MIQLPCAIRFTNALLFTHNLYIPPAIPTPTSYPGLIAAEVLQDDMNECVGMSHSFWRHDDAGERLSHGKPLSDRIDLDSFTRGILLCPLEISSYERGGLKAPLR